MLAAEFLCFCTYAFLFFFHIFINVHEIIQYFYSWLTYLQVWCYHYKNYYNTIQTSITHPHSYSHTLPPTISIPLSLPHTKWLPWTCQFPKIHSFQFTCIWAGTKLDRLSFGKLADFEGIIVFYNLTLFIFFNAQPV